MTSTQICSICLEDGSDCELLCCGSHYHVVCILKWVKIQESDAMLMQSCPMCRREVGVIRKPPGTWHGFVWSLNRFLEEGYDQWRNTRGGRRFGSCECTMYFSYCVVVFVLMLRLFSAAAGLRDIFTWNMIGLAGMYTIFISFLNDFFTSSD